MQVAPAGVSANFAWLSAQIYVLHVVYRMPEELSPEPTELLDGVGYEKAEIGRAGLRIGSAGRGNRTSAPRLRRSGG
jgi:hypothetical protein